MFCLAFPPLFSTFAFALAKGSFLCSLEKQAEQPVASTAAITPHCKTQGIHNVIPIYALQVNYTVNFTSGMFCIIGIK